MYKSEKLRKHLITNMLSVLMLVASFSLSGQTPISGVINQYVKVTAVGTDYVTVTSTAGFSVGDTVLLMQMKGLRIYTTNDALYGTAESLYGRPGNHEFFIVQAVGVPGVSDIRFTNNILGTFDANGSVQLIKVPFYNSATVTAQLTAQAWNPATGTGGVLAFFVGTSLNLNADIDVTGKGFKGGATAMGDDLCSETVGHSDYSYATASILAGFKGEGIATSNNAFVPLDPGFTKGKGANFTGGGAGSGRYPGGGGGGSLGAGGLGYFEDGCSSLGRGIGGKGWATTAVDGYIFMGGGGGSSVYTGGGIPSPGANGGGIILIVADIINGNGFKIKADGDSVSVVASGTAGAGGGGGAGTIALSVQNYGPSSLTVTARGGEGGDVDKLNTFGMGGGGGGGLIWLKTAFSGGASGQIGGGLGGIIREGSVRAISGSPGAIRTSFIVNLTGFLFNSVSSSFSGNQIDTICQNIVLPTLNGTSPLGGTGTYTYQWERKFGAGAWTPVGAATSKNYATPPAEAVAGDVFFRRVVQSGAITDISKEIKFTVLPIIVNTNIGTDTTICFSQDPNSLYPLITTPGGGSGVYTYVWQQSPDNFGTAPQVPGGTITGSKYDPAALTTDTWYRRIVNSSVCTNISNAVKITVLPSITNNNIASDQTLCEGSLFTDLAHTGVALAGGNATYLYKWEQSNDNIAFIDATGVITGAGYDPDEALLLAAGKKYFRRIVYSGPVNTCQSTSPSVALELFGQITGNLIDGDTTICFNQNPDPLYPANTGPAGGSGSYTYIWEVSNDNFATAPQVPGGTITLAGYDPPALSSDKWYRRVANSDVCTSTSPSIKITVLPLILNNNIQSDQSICEGTNFTDLVQSGPAITGGDGSYNYKWEVSADNFATAPTVPFGTINTASYNPDEASLTGLGNRYFRRVVFSGLQNQCADTSTSVTLNIFGAIANNTLPPVPEVCYGTFPARINGLTPTGGSGTYNYSWEQSPDNISWVVATGTPVAGGSFDPPAVTDIIYYRRIVKSGPANECTDISSGLIVDTLTLPTGLIADVVQNSCEGTAVPVGLTLTGSGNWDVVLSNGTVDSLFTSITTPVSTITRKPINNSTYTITSIKDNVNGCLATSKAGSHQVTVFRYPNANAGANGEACGLTYTLNAVPSIGVGTWDYKATPVTTAANAITSPSHTVTVAGYGTWRFWWRETNWQCKDSASVDVTFWQQPDPADAGPDQLLLPFEFNTSLNAANPVRSTSTKWSVVSSKGTPLFGNDVLPGTTVSDLWFGQNELEWTVINGVCPPATDRVIVEVPGLVIPGGFSPGNDGINDTFEIGIHDGTENELVIINIKGVEVFRMKNYSATTGFWDGKDRNGADVPEGTYYYLFTISKPVADKYSGYIIIKRAGR